MNALALLGGAFDPFHNGHDYLARRAAEIFHCPLLIIPNGCPPHRPPPAAAWRDRLSICRLATAGVAGVQVSDIETPPQVHYTADTLARLKQWHPDAALLLIIGSDSYNSFMWWRSPQRILELAHLVVVRRPGTDLVLRSGDTIIHDEAGLYQGSGGVYLWECAPPAVSASACRAAVTAGEDINGMVPAAAAEYIRAEGLYSLNS